MLNTKCAFRNVFLLLSDTLLDSVLSCKFFRKLQGWAQVDTAQDASWFGTRASPDKCTILNFAEGDVTRTVFDTDEEFAAAIREIDRWNRDHGYGPVKINPGFDPALKAAFEWVGLGDKLH